MSSKVKTVISLLSITIILVCLFQAIPKYNEIRKHNTVGQNKVEITSAPTETIGALDSYTNESNVSTSDEAGKPHVDYRTTQEYKDNRNRINALQERINLLKNGIVADLTDTVNLGFSQISKALAEPEDKDLMNDCRLYMTEDFYNRFKDMKFESASYMISDIKFGDLDKDEITAYVRTRDSRRFFVTFSFDQVKNYAISNIEQIKE